MGNALVGGAGFKGASTHDKGDKIETSSIWCDEVSAPMLNQELSHDDLMYIRDRIAEGIARMLVEKVAKSSDLAVDNSEPERYNPAPQKGGTAI